MRSPAPGASAALPRYVLRAANAADGRRELEIRQLPGPASPHLAAPLRVAGLRGRALELAETRILRRLRRAGIALPHAPGARSEHPLAEGDALSLGLLFRVLAPMRSPDRMRDAADGVEAMPREEAAYWLGMAMHRRSPRRVLAALRMLLSDPEARP